MNIDKETDMKVSLCFSGTEGNLFFDDYPSSMRVGEPVISYQRSDEIGYTFDLQDMRLNNHSYTGLTAVGYGIVLIE